MSEPRRPSLSDQLANAAFLGLIGVGKLLPYPQRIAASGWLFSKLLAPIAGWRQRIATNLDHAWPELPADKREALIKAVPDNVGRSIAEIYSGAEFLDRLAASDPLEGSGLAALEEAAAAGRPAILAVAHFGNYDAMRGAIAARGWPVGALYRPMNNPAFNRHYIPAIHKIAQPLFPRGRQGLASMLRFLKSGGFLCLGFDQYDGQAPDLQFFGKPTATVLTPAELALRYDAVLVPVAGIRQADGISFKVHVGAPIPPSKPDIMMQALNDDLEALIRQHPGQWFWVHRRWKNHI